jgi:ribose transport system ATP-binding protein
MLKAEGLTKRFPGVLALEKVSLQAAAGEVTAVIGENGAGKSTLMKLLAGIHKADEGSIEIDGKALELHGVLQTQSAGISLIHQELNMADNLDVAANVWLGREPHHRGFIQKEVMRQQTEPLLQRLGATFSADTPVAKLSLGQRQLVEIAKALSLKARVLIMDEPTSSLSAKEAEALFRIIQELKLQGLAILYISHRLGEVKELADRVVALRDGRNAGVLARHEINHESMVRLMVGREHSQAFRHVPQAKTWVVLDVQNLRTQAHPQHSIGFDLHRGEIVGLAGLVGSGRTEILRALFGIEPPLKGQVLLNGEKLQARHPQEAIAAGMALVPEDRKALGVFLPESVRWNVSLPAVARAARGGIFLDTSFERKAGESMREHLQIKTTSLETLVGTLSGGNQQKVALGKWLTLAPKVLLLDEPTRGIDVGGKREIYQLIEKLAGEGMAILFVSSDLEEIMALSDRVLVMHEGALAGELPRHLLSEEAIMRLATSKPYSVHEYIHEETSTARTS